MVCRACVNDERLASLDGLLSRTPPCPQGPIMSSLPAEQHSDEHSVGPVIGTRHMPLIHYQLKPLMFACEAYHA